MLVKVKDLVLKPIIILEQCKKKGTIKEIIYDREERKIKGFIIDRGSFFSYAKILFYDNVYQINCNTLLIKYINDIIKMKKEQFKNEYRNLYNIIDKDVVDINNNFFGVVHDIEFNKGNGNIKHLIISQSYFDDLVNGYVEVPLDDRIIFEDDLIVINTKDTSYLKSNRSRGIK